MAKTAAERVRAWRLRNPEKAAKQSLKSQIKHRAQYPERVRARTAIGSRIRRGTLKRKACQICGARKTQAHHPDYSKPLEVFWLCEKHHRAVHRNEKSPLTELFHSVSSEVSDHQ